MLINKLISSFKEANGIYIRGKEDKEKKEKTPTMWKCDLFLCPWIS